MGKRRKIAPPLSSANPTEWTVAELLDCCATNPTDEVAWNEFVRRYHTTIKKNVVQVFHNRSFHEAERKPELSNDQVEDLVQAVYMRLIKDSRRALQKFRGLHCTSIYRYLMMICYNVVRDYFRELRAIKRPRILCSFQELMDMDEEVLDLLETLPKTEEEPDSPTNWILTKEDVEEALRQMASWKSRERDLLIFKLRFYEGLSLAEITKLRSLKLSKRGASTAINRVLKKLRGYFQRQAKKARRIG